jgi:hypothetical protein
MGKVGSELLKSGSECHDVQSAYNSALHRMDTILETLHSAVTIPDV